MIDIFYLDKDVKKGKEKDLAKLKNKKVWIDVTKITHKEVDKLCKLFDLHPVTKEDMLLSHGRIKVEQFTHYMFNTFYTIEKGRKRINLIPLEFVLGKNFLITTHPIARENFERLKERKDKLKRLFKSGVESIFHYLLDREIDQYFPILEELDDEIEKIDERIALHSDASLMGEILEIKRKIVEIKKITFPQREKISYLSKRKYKFIPEKSKPYFRDIYDQSIRVSDVIENFREAIGSTFDAYMTSVANTQNDIMKVLSVIATIFLPLTVISGIYGTNFIKLPGSQAINGFWIMMIAMSILTLVMLLFFKRRGWF